MQGDQWEIFGKAAAAAIPVMMLLAVGVGFFAAQTYENGASVFLESPSSPTEPARLVPLEQLGKQ